MVRGKSIYAELYIKNSYRAKCSPRVKRPMRPRAIAWAGPDAFYPNRFYEMDRWYKARIQKPELLPELYVVDVTKINKSYEELIKEPLTDMIDIGFKVVKEKVSAVSNKKEFEMLDEAIVNLDKLKFNQLEIFKHCNIFQDLFQSNVFFNITQNGKFSYENGDVERGNVLKCSDMKNEPKVELESFNSNAFNTVIMVNLDGNAFTKVGQIAHWMVSNIPDGKGINDGEVVVPYLQPLPFKGTGYHRIVFITFRHKEKLSFDNVIEDSNKVSGRVMNVLKFFKTNEDSITPSSICFSQVTWDETVDGVLKEMGEGVPEFEYEWREPLVRKQREYPENPQPFDLYLDKYRPKEVVYKEIETMKLEMSTSDGPPKKPKYPDFDYVNNKKKLPHWEHQKLLRKNSGVGVYGRLYD
uniref:Large ribosomal subunit protein mL38 n=1 Tax=Strongyloides venezuelensis TaxID=75913 RepID=A0A0K0F2W4_STRVS